MIARRSFLAGSSVGFLFAPVSAQTTTRKPRLPPGRDPGGPAIAIIGDGVDYVDPIIASRLARDGEGELIGWDFIDNDNRPFATGDGGGGALRTYIGALPSARFIPIRVTNVTSMLDVRALGFALRTPAQFILLSAEISRPSDIQKLRGLADSSRSVLVIAIVSIDAGVHLTTQPADNVLLVPERAAATSALRLAVRLLQVEGIATGEALKRRLLASPEFLRTP